MWLEKNRGLSGSSLDMSNEPQQNDEDLPDEVERRFQKLEEEEEARKDAKSNSDNPSYTASAAELGQDQAEHVNSADSHQEISACFEAAIKKLDKVDADANKKNSEIIQELARNLEGKMPTDEIAS